MKRALLALVGALLLASPSFAQETCTLTQTGIATWYGSPPTSGDATWSGCTPTEDDNWVIPDGFSLRVTGGDLGSAASPLLGSIDVQAGGALYLDANVTIYHSGLLLYDYDSLGDYGTRAILQTWAVPYATTYTSSTDIRFDFRDYLNTNKATSADENVLPWAICSSSCTKNDIHAASAGNYPATLIYFGHEKFGATEFLAISSDGTRNTRGALAAGWVLEVVAVHDLDSNGANDSFTVRLPTTGPTAGRGALHYGADNSAVPVTGSSGSRAEESMTMSAGGARVSAPQDTSGGYLRNAIQEADWEIAAPATRRRLNNRFKARNEILFDPSVSPFDTDHEFDGFIIGAAASLNGDRDDYRARIINSDADAWGNETQTITLSGSCTTTFTLTYAGQTTSALDCTTADGAAVKAALDLLSTIPNESSVTGSAGGPYAVVFDEGVSTGNKVDPQCQDATGSNDGCADTDTDAITCDASNCTSVVETQKGSQGELVVVWSDPTGRFKDGDLANVLLISPRPADIFTPFNPVKFVGGRQAFHVFHYSSLAGRTNPATGLWWSQMGPNKDTGLDSPWNLCASSQADCVGVRFDNVFDLEVGYFLNEHFGGNGPAGGEFDSQHAAFGLRTVAGVPPEAANVYIHHGDVRFPDAYTDISPYDGESVAFVVITDESVTEPPSGDPADIWTGVTFQQIRTSGFANSYASALGPRFQDCKDGFLLHQAIFEHGRLAYNANIPKGIYNLEVSSFSDTCALDGIVLGGSTNGPPARILCQECTAGKRAHISDLFVYGARLAQANEVVAYGLGAYEFLMDTTNYVVQGQMQGAVAHYYGTLQDYFIGPVPGVNGCQDNYGFYLSGGVEGATFGSSAGSTCNTDAIIIRDLYLTSIPGVNGQVFQTNNITSGARVDLQRFYTSFAGDASVATLLKVDGNSTPVPFTINYGTWRTERGTGSNRSFIQADGDSVTANGAAVGPVLFGNGGSRCSNVGSGSDVFQETPTDKRAYCVVNDAFAPCKDGDGDSCTGRNFDSAGGLPTVGEMSGEFSGLNQRPVYFSPTGVPAVACTNAATLGAGATPHENAVQECNLEEALPRYAGILYCGWACRYMTLNPIPGFRRTTPDLTVVPKYIKDRIRDVQLSKGGGGGETLRKWY